MNTGFGNEDHTTNAQHKKIAATKDRRILLFGVPVTRSRYARKLEAWCRFGLEGSTPEPRARAPTRVRFRPVRVFLSLVGAECVSTSPWGNRCTRGNNSSFRSFITSNASFDEAQKKYSYFGFCNRQRPTKSSKRSGKTSVSPNFF